MTTQFDPTPESEAPTASSGEPRSTRAAAASSRRSLLRWATAGATVLALGAGATLLASSALPTAAQTGPTATPSPAAPPRQPGQFGPGGQQQPGGGWLLGVMVSDATNGARVDRVMPGSAAEKAGLQVGDVITAVDGQSVQNAQGLRDRLSGKQAGNTVALTVTRNGASTNVTATLAAPPIGQRGPGGFRGERGGFGGFAGVPGVDALQGVPADQRFAHTLGSQTTVLDANGNRVTYQTTPGKVTSVSATSLTIQANDPTRGTVTYTITGDTKVMVRGQRGQGQAPTSQPSATPTTGHARPQAPAQAPQGSITDLKAGDNVIVVADAANPTVAKAVAGLGQPSGQ